MRTVENSAKICGYLYDIKLEKKVTGAASKNPGTEYIGGSLEVAVDEGCVNVVPVYYTYVTKTTKAGAENKIYAALSKIIDENKTVLSVGKENAQKIKLTPSINVSDFPSKQDPSVWVTAQRFEGGFITTDIRSNDNFPSAEFVADVVFNKSIYIEEDPEKNIDSDRIKIKGVAFGVMNKVASKIIPVEFLVKVPSGVKYFESLGLNDKNMVFTKVKGRINSLVSVSRKEEEAAFGDALVTEYSRVSREWEVYWCPANTYEIGDEEQGIGVDELKKFVEDRNVYLANEKKRREDYEASKSAGGFGTVAPTATAVKPDMGFNF